MHSMLYFHGFSSLLYLKSLWSGLLLVWFVYTQNKFPYSAFVWEATYSMKKGDKHHKNYVEA